MRIVVSVRPEALTPQLAYGFGEDDEKITNAAETRILWHQPTKTDETWENQMAL